MNSLRNMLSRAILLGTLVIACGGPAHAEMVPVPIDQRIALGIGTHKVSHYIIDKYYNRSISSLAQKSEEARVQASKGWLELFLARQVVIAHAASLGFADRSEVRDVVGNMERHMLTQSRGPYYEAIYSPPVVTKERLHACYQKSDVRRQISIVRFDNGALAANLLGADFSSQNTEGKLRLISAISGELGVTFHKGTMSWPFEPFIEIEDLLSNATVGEWLEHRDSLLGTYYAFIHADLDQPQPKFTDHQVQLELIISEVDRRTFLRRHRARCLATAEFRLQLPVAQRLLKGLQSLPWMTTHISKDQFEEFGEETLFQYRIDGTLVVISAEQYREYLNRLFIRKAPTDLATLSASAKDMVVENYDLNAALASGIHRTPQFSEDRHGFRHLQILDYYEKTCLLTATTPNAEEIVQYYNDHPAEFRRIVSVRGRLFTGTAAEQNGLEVVETIDITLDNAPAGFEGMVSFILRSPLGTRFGPVQRGKEFVSFIKDEDLKIGDVPLEEASGQIKADLQRQRLDQRVLQLARGLAKDFKIQDHIDYTRYGLTAAEVAVPWRE